MKTSNPKQQFAIEVLKVKNYVCTSNAMVKWCKNYLNRSTRRIEKQSIKKELKTYE